MMRLFTLCLLLLCIGCSRDESTQKAISGVSNIISIGMDLDDAIISLDKAKWKNAKIPYKPSPPFNHYSAFTNGKGIVLVLLHDKTKIKRIELSDNNSSKPSKMIKEYILKN